MSTLGRRRSLLARAGLMLGALPLLVVGCGGGGGGAVSGGPAGTGAVNACVRMPASDDHADVLAVAIDRSGSTRGNGGPDYLADLSNQIRTAVGKGDVVSVGGFDGSTATMTWTTVATRFPGNGTKRVFQREAAVSCLIAASRAAAAGPAVAPGTDVLGALVEAAKKAAVTSGHRQIVVASDGLSTVGCTDLFELPLGIDVTKVAAQCRSQHSLPDLRGTDVSFLGLGRSASVQPVLSTQQDDWLQTLWVGLCVAAAGGDRTGCGLDERTPPSLSGAGVVAPAGAADPKVTFPAVVTTRAAGVIDVSLPDGVLFDTDSHSLLPSADTAFGEVRAAVAAGGPGRIVGVVGHTDSRGSDAHNDLLSLARAQAVASALRDQYHLAVRGVRGAGERQPRCTPDIHPDGTPDEAAMQCNRRVDVLVAVSTDQG